MKTILIMLMCLVSTLSFASSDEVADLLHKRMVMRDAQIYSGSEFNLTSLDNPDIAVVVDREYKRMLDFASDLNLEEKGFSYKVNDKAYQVIKNDSVIGYTFSIVIIKNKKPYFRRFYILSKRVDGIFFVSRIANYEFE